MISYFFSKINDIFHPASFRKTKIAKKSKVGSYSSVYKSSIDNYSYVGNHCLIVFADIGKFCSIGNYCFIGNPEHPISFVSTSPIFYGGYNIFLKKVKMGELTYDSFPKKVVIGNDVFIGNNVVIKDGVKIGNGAVIAAGSVVTKDIPDYEIWGGNPAMKIRDRFSPEITEKLKEIQWWNFDEIQLKKVSMYMNNPLEFISFFERGCIQ